MIKSDLIGPIGSYLSGQWVTSGDDTFEVINPATGEVLAGIPKVNSESAWQAIDQVAEAGQTDSTIEQRSTWLSKLASLILDNKKELGRIITLEHGKPWTEAIGEVEYAASFFNYYSRAVYRLQPHELTERPKDHRWTVYYRPAGVVALITPWNFPLAMLAKKFSAALAADCSSIIKCSSKTPLSMIAFFSLIEQLDLPVGKANLLLGSANAIGEVLCTHPAIRVLSFTGSTSVGKKLMASAAPHLKRLSLELGGNAPFIVFEDADLSVAVDALMLNKFRGGGQTCVCANRVLVEKSIVQEFAKRLVERVKQMKLGDGIEKDTDIGSLISVEAVEKVGRHLDDALQKGAQCLAGGPDALSDAQKVQGTYFAPTVLAGVTEQMLCVQEETFGPIAPLMTFDSENEAVQMANDTEYGLAAYLFTTDDNRAHRIVRALRFGHVGLNTGTGPTAEAPFGGMKHSGFGREGGDEGLHEFVEPQTVPRP